MAGLTIVPMGADGKVDLFNGSPGTTNLVADIVGYFRTTGGNAYVPVTPTRMFDTRQEQPIGPRMSTVRSPEPADLSGGVVMNLTVTRPQQGGFLLVGPYPLPAGLITSASTVNWSTPGQTVANLAIPSSAPPSSSAFTFYNDSDGSTDVIADLLGYVDTATPQTLRWSRGCPHPAAMPVTNSWSTHRNQRRGRRDNSNLETHETSVNTSSHIRL